MDTVTWSEADLAQPAGELARCALLDAISLSVLTRLREQDALRGRLLFLEGRTIVDDAGRCVCLDNNGTTHVGQTRIVLGDAEQSSLEFELSSWAGHEGQLLRGRLALPEGHDVTVLAIHDVAAAPQGAGSFANTGFMTLLGGTGRFKGANGIARFSANYELCELGLGGRGGARLRTAFTLDWVHWRRLPTAMPERGLLPMPLPMAAAENNMIYQGGL